MIFEDNWIPQTEYKENIAASLASFCKMNSLQISKKTIFETHAGGEQMAHFNEIEKFCNNWGIECRAIGFENSLPQEFLPAFVLTTGYITQLVVKIEDDSVFYLDAVNGWVEKSKEEFFATSMGFATLIMNFDHYKPEPDFEKKTKEEEDRIRQIREQFDYSIVDDFMTSEECDDLIEKGEGLLKKSMVVANDDGKESSVESNIRTSSSAFLTHSDELFDRIRERASKLINVNIEKFESVQLTSYTKGQKYEVHSDSFLPADIGALKFGQRTHTILVYLKDDYKGGGTLFPHLNLTVKPLKGRAVIWSGLKENKEINPHGYHGGLPVQEGRKTVCNLWVRDQDQPNWQ